MSYLPPQAKELEQHIIGAIISDPGSHATIFSELQEPEIFYSPQMQAIFTSAQKLTTTDQDIDLMSLTEQLKLDNKMQEIGGEYELVKLMQNYTGGNIEQHALILKQYWIKRKLMQMGQMLQSESSKESADAFHMLDTFRKQYDAIDQELERVRVKTWSETLDEVYQDVKDLSESSSGLVGQSTGLQEIDNITGGLIPGELIILAARPGMGKTAMAVKWATTAAAGGKPTAVFQLEMSNKQFAKRVLALESEHLHANQLYKHGLRTERDWQNFTDVISQTQDYPLHVVPKPGMSVYDCMIEARRLKSKHNIGLIIVDYLQLMGGTAKHRNSNREQEISEVSRNLKKLALELDIPVVALSQLSRAVETRGGNKKPLLSDLRESGSIEQDADEVLFLYRPAYYGIEDQDGVDVSRSCEVIIAKHRNGSLGSVWVGFDDNKVKFRNLNQINQVDEVEF